MSITLISRWHQPKPFFAIIESKNECWIGHVLCSCRLFCIENISKYHVCVARSPCGGCVVNTKALLYFPPRAKSIAWSDLENKTFGTNKNQKPIKEKHKTQKQRTTSSSTLAKGRGVKEEEHPQLQSSKEKRLIEWGSASTSRKRKRTRAGPRRPREKKWSGSRCRTIRSSFPPPARSATRPQLDRSETSWPGTERLGFTSGTPISSAFTGSPFASASPTRLPSSLHRLLRFPHFPSFLFVNFVCLSLVAEKLKDTKVIALNWA